MIKITIKDRATQETTNGPVKFPTNEEALEWVSIHVAKGESGKAWGLYYCERELPKKGLNYDNEVDYNEELLVEDGEFIKEFDNKDPEMWVRLHAEYEYTIEDVTAEHEAAALRRDTVAIGKLYKNRCEDALNYIAGCNVSRLDEAQIDAMEITFEEVTTKLLKGRPDKAYGLIANITPDGTIVTEEIKTEMLAILAGN